MRLSWPTNQCPPSRGSSGEIFHVSYLKPSFILSIHIYNIPPPMGHHTCLLQLWTLSAYFRAHYSKWAVYHTTPRQAETVFYFYWFILVSIHQKRLVLKGAKVFHKVENLFRVWMNIPCTSEFDLKTVFHFLRAYLLPFSPDVSLCSSEPKMAWGLGWFITNSLIHICMSYQCEHPIQFYQVHSV